MRDWLIKLRKEKNLTQAEVASRAYIDRTYYGQIENRKRRPSQEVALKISKVLHFNPANFFSEGLHEPLNILLEGSHVVVAKCDLDLRYIWIFNTPPDFAPYEPFGKRDDELGDHQGSLELMKLKQDIIDLGKPLRKTIVYEFSYGTHTYEIYGRPVFDDHSKVIEVITVAIDLTPLEVVDLAKMKPK